MRNDPMTTSALNPIPLCVVCSETVTVEFEAQCMTCGATYHLQQRNDIPGKDCGQVWIDEEHLGLVFTCDTCLAPEPVASNLDDVLDLDEAAGILALSTGELARLAQSGAVRHRRTSSGILLFMRRDLLEMPTGSQQ